MTRKTKAGAKKQGSFVDDGLLNPRIRVCDGNNTLEGVLSKLKVRHENLFPCFPSEWVSRFVALRGHYLFSCPKKPDPNTKAFTRIKGTPINVLDCNLRSPVEALNAVNLPYDPELASRVFCLSSLDKDYIYACENEAERNRWVTELCKQRDKAMKQKLGHAKCSFAEAEANRIGDTLRDSKVRRESQLNKSHIVHAVEGSVLMS